MQQDSPISENYLLNLDFLLEQIKPPKIWFQDTVHEQQFSALIIKILDLNMEEKSKVLLMLMTLFNPFHVNVRKEDGDELYKHYNFFKKLLYRYLCSKSGQGYGNYNFEKHINTMEFMQKLQSLDYRKQV